MGVIRKEGITSVREIHFSVLLEAFNTFWIYSAYFETSEIVLIAPLAPYE